MRLRLSSTSPSGNARLKSGDVPRPEVDTPALLALLSQLVKSLSHPYAALFAVLDSTGTQWNYGYTTLDFDTEVLEQANGKTRPFFYTRINEDGFQVVVAAVLPATPSAFRNFRMYLNAPVPTDLTPVKTSNLQKSSTSVSQSSCGNDGVFECGIIIWDSDSIDLYCYPKLCVVATELEPDDSGGGGYGGGAGGYPEDPPCLIDPSQCVPGGGTSVPSQQDCSGVVNGLAYWDPVCSERCVGGNTGRIPAPAGSDCTNLNLPCAGDVVKNPVLQVPAVCPSSNNPQRCTDGGSGKKGARFTVGENAVRSNRSRNHWGTDIKCRLGQPIYPLRQGRVVHTQHQRNHNGVSVGHGRWVDVEYTNNDGSKFYVRYAHLQDVNYAQVNSVINVNSVIGYCGKTGNAANGYENDNDYTHAHIETSTSQTFNNATRSDPEVLFVTKFDEDGNVENENPWNQ